jgi:hypothetical protein
LIEDEWAGMRLICIGDSLSQDDLPATIRQNNLHLNSNESETTTKPLRYDVVEENFGLWSYEEEEIEEGVTVAAMEASVKPKSRALRNLTTSQFVLEDQLSSGITIGHIILMRICWSTESSTGITGGEYLARGDWAGYEFDIVDVDKLKNSNEKWKDVTEGTCDEFKALWANHFGKNWETEWTA